MRFQEQLLRVINLLCIIYLVRTKKVCDVRVWYLNMINDDVFNVDLTDAQHNLKVVIESLVMKASESRETRMLECSTLYLYDDMLKDLFNYMPSGSGMELKEVDIEGETVVKDAISPSNDKNKDTIENKDAMRESEHLNVKDRNLEIDDSNMYIDNNEGNVEIDNGDTDTPGSETITAQSASFVNVDEEENFLNHENEKLSSEEEHIDETEYSEDMDPDLSSFDDTFEESVQENQTYNSALQTGEESYNENFLNKADVSVTKSIPFGVCYSFGCLTSDIFDVYNRGDVKQSNDINIEEILVKPETDKRRMTHKFKLKCPFRSLCTQYCYYKYLLSKSFCMTSLIPPENVVELTENNKDRNQNKKESTEAIYEQETIDDNNSEMHSNVDSVKMKKSLLVQYTNHRDKSSTEAKFINKLSMADFENILEQKTTKYNSKIQNLEVMLLKLENQLLTTTLHKQNHSSTITKLENQILKFENELLRMNKHYQNLREETESKSRRQHKYLELAYKQTRKDYPKLPDKSNDNYELMTKHQAKINELKEVLKNQSRQIMQLKGKQDYMEEQNKMLHEMVMNQSIFMNSIVKTVQDLSEQNIKNKNEITALRLQVLQNKATTDAKKVDGNAKDNHGVINELDTLLFDNFLEKSSSMTKDNTGSKHNVMKEKNVEFQLKNHNKIKSGKTLVLNWCPRNGRTCPSCYYSPYIHLNCLPYRSVLWTELWEKNSKEQSVEEGDYPTVPDVIDDIEKTNLVSTSNVDLLKVHEQELHSKPDKVEESGVTNTYIVQNDNTIENNRNLIQREENYITNEDNFVQNIDHEDKIEEAQDTIKAKKENTDADETEFSKYTLVGYDRNGKPVFIIGENAKDKGEITEPLPTDIKTKTTTEKTESLTSEELTLNEDDIINEQKFGENYGIKADSIKQEQGNSKTFNKPKLVSNDQEQIRFQVKHIDKDIDNDQFKERGDVDNNANRSVVNDVIKSDSLRKDSEISKLGEQSKSEKESTVYQGNNIKNTNDEIITNKERNIVDLKEAGIKHTENQASKDDKVAHTKQKTNEQQKNKQSVNKPKERKIPINIDKPKQNEQKDCYDIYLKGERRDGLYKVKPIGSDKQIQVFCDMRKGGWTVIQRRQDGTTNFFQEWDDYKKGFGGLYGEHWLGNDNLHYLTNQDFYKLRVEMMDWEKTKKFAEFDYFLVENEDEGYKLHINGYNGDAGDGLTKHDGSKFSTKDVDNDKVVKEFGGSCAKRFNGAGWYYKCYASNLNGKFYKGGKIPEKRFDGVTWKPWTGPNYSLKKVEMKIRPASAKN